MPPARWPQLVIEHLMGGGFGPQQRVQQCEGEQDQQYRDGDHAAPLMQEPPSDRLWRPSCRPRFRFRRSVVEVPRGRGVETHRLRTLGSRSTYERSASMFASRMTNATHTTT